MENNYWYVGQKVSDQRFGNGVIIKIGFNREYAIEVIFENGSGSTYTKEGKISVNDAFSSLSQNPHKPLEYTKIYKQVNKDDIVLYSTGNGIKFLGIYNSFEEGIHLVVDAFNVNNSVHSYAYVSDEDIELYVK